MDPSQSQPEQSIQACCQQLLKQTRQAAQKEEIPQASLILATSQIDSNSNNPAILVLDCNAITRKRDPTQHAEIRVIQRACQQLDTERLTGYSMFSCLEPCLMCSGAIVHARLDRLYYMSATDKGPGMRWLTGMSHASPQRLNHYPELISLHSWAPIYRRLLVDFFQKKR